MRSALPYGPFPFSECTPMSFLLSCGPYHCWECTPIWSLTIRGVHSHMVPITFKNAFQSGPPYIGPLFDEPIEPGVRVCNHMSRTIRHTKMLLIINNWVSQNFFYYKFLSERNENKLGLSWGHYAPITTIIRTSEFIWITTSHLI